MKACTSSPSMVTMKSRLLKRMCALRVQLMLWLAIQSLMVMVKHAKDPNQACQLSAF
jgi:hypothetical protein